MPAVQPSDGDGVAVACPQCGATGDQLLLIRSSPRKPSKSAPGQPAQPGRRRRVFCCTVCSPPFADMPDSDMACARKTTRAHYYATHPSARAPASN